MELNVATGPLPVDCRREHLRLRPNIGNCLVYPISREQHWPQPYSIFQRPSTEILFWREPGLTRQGIHHGVLRLLVRGAPVQVFPLTSPKVTP